MNKDGRGQFHTLLQRQMKKQGLDPASTAADVLELLKTVSDTYRDLDQDRAMLERSMEISSKELLRSNLEMRAIIAGLPDILYRIEKNGDVVNLNSRHILCNVSSPNSRFIEEVHGEFDDETNSYLLSTIRQALVEKRETTVEYSLDDETTTFYEMRLAPLADGSLIAITRNISDIRKIAKKLERARDMAEAANRSKSLFLANMSHEVRTPISGMTGMTELLQKTDLDQHQQSLIDMLKSSSINLMAIVDDILDISRAEISGLELHCDDFSLRNSIDATVKQVLGASRSKPERITLSIDDDVPDCVNGDRARIAQILINLLGNAVKFSAADAAVELKVSTQTEPSPIDPFELRLDVVDRGVGIKESDLDTIFRPFFQLKQSGKAHHEGVGLGLSITKRLVELMQGTLMVDSELGKGSIFTAIIPLRAAESNLDEDRETDQQDITGALLPAQILVAEDNPVNQTHIRYLLKGLGMEVTIVEDGRQAVDQVLEGKYDLVLMDCRMPVLDGWAATREIRRHEESAGKESALPILALTAHAMKGDRAVCLAAGMTDYLAKPVDEQQLVEVLRTYIPQS